MVVHRKKWRRAPRQPHPPRRPILTDLVGRCFNCHQTDHIIVDCVNPAHCLCCHLEGHQARASKHLQSSEHPPQLTC
jgi:hypothetical protein